MFPKINMKETGANIRKLMEERGITAKDVQEYLKLARANYTKNTSRQKIICLL